MQENYISSQKLTLENRRIITISDVTDVESSNDTQIKLNTNSGKLSIFGTNLKINNIDLKTGDFKAVGLISRLEYKSTKNNKISDILK